MTERKYEQLEKMLCAELEEIVDKGTLSAGDLDVVDKLTHALKNTYKVHMGEAGEYSQTGEWSMMGSSPVYSRNYERGNSYSRGRTGYVKRDGMGRYSSAAVKEEMIGKLEEMMGMADSEKERDALRNCISKIENI